MTETEFILASWIIIAAMYFVIYKQDRLIDKMKAIIVLQYEEIEQLKKGA